MIKKAINDHFNKQINEEIFSFYLYLSMAAYYESENLPGFGHWFKMQAQEELIHAMRFFNHIVERGGKVVLAKIKDPQTKWDSPLKAAKDALKHEEFITGCINNLMDAAMKEKDYAARNLLNWFIDEQVEEEASATENVVQLERVGAQKHLLFMLDKEKAARPAAVNPFLPTPVAQA